MFDSHEKFFAGIPIVFGGTSEQQADNPPLDSHFTGCWEMFEPAKTLDVALRLQPGSRHIVVVGGVSSFDKHLEAIYRESLRSYEANLDFTYLTDLDMPALLERLKGLPAHTIVLYTHFGMDAKGTRYIGASQAGPMIAATANAPVYAPSDVDLGHGEVGGYLQSFAREGKIVGGIAVRILNGERPQDVPIVRGANAYMFDWRALKRWGFRENRPSARQRCALPSTVFLGAHQMDMGSRAACHPLSGHSRLVPPVEAGEKPANGAQRHADYRTGKRAQSPGFGNP